MNLKQAATTISFVLTLWGCSTGRHAAHYGWLRKQGPVKEAQRPVIHGGEEAAAALETNQPPDPDPVPALEAVANGPQSVELNLAATVRAEPKTFLSAAKEEPFQLVTALQTRPDTGYFDEHAKRWNAKAVAALPAAIAALTLGFALQGAWILLIGGAIAFALGLIGSRQCRDREDRGKGLAIAGMALGAVALFLGGLALLLGA